MRVVTIVEPYFMPWLGYLHRLIVSDVVVMLDHVKYPKGTYCNRVQVQQRNGPSWISVPIKRTTEADRIADATIYELNWVNKALNVIKYNYCTCEYFDLYFPLIKQMLKNKTSSLLQYDLEILHGMLDILGFSIHDKMIFSSEAGEVGKKNVMNMNLVKFAGGNVYYSGNVARVYNDPSIFRDAGIHLTYHNWIEPTYNHRWGKVVSGMSAIDALFHLGAKFLHDYIAEQVEKERSRLINCYSNRECAPVD